MFSLLIFFPANLSASWPLILCSFLPFVERESLADTRLLNSAPASHRVPLHGSRCARRTLSSCGQPIFFLPVSLPFSLAFFPHVLSLRRSPLLLMRAQCWVVISAPAADVEARKAPCCSRKIRPSLQRKASPWKKK